ncbi:hypothetical protein BN1221_03051c [Brenneria goodwinii]|uniref:Uncharacterized protein n=1 Tax=Brenneria goodwinii TaxID=1109412 RepID=A0A0G4JXA9_9GAMM|nr:hypothetical protein BN1221_03051c [Brenneria goodwinii]
MLDQHRFRRIKKVTFSVTSLNLSLLFISAYFLPINILAIFHPFNSN